MNLLSPYLFICVYINLCLWHGKYYTMINQKQAAFYCNTVDVAFGPTFSTYDYDLDVGVFYKWWDSSVGKDPRNYGK